jgi:hypothetical protein
MHLHMTAPVLYGSAATSEAAMSRFDVLVIQHATMTVDQMEVDEGETTWDFYQRMCKHFGAKPLALENGEGQHIQITTGLTLLEVGVAKDRPAVVIKFPVPQGTVEQPTATSIICLDCLQKKMCNIHTEEQTYMHLG